MQGHPILDGRVRVPAYSRQIRFDLELAFDIGAVVGRIDDGEARAQPMVRLEPLDPTLIPARLVARANPDGRFQIDGVAPGRYWVYAKGRQVQLDFGDPAVRARYARFGKEIDVRPGATAAVDLRMIR